MLKMFCRIREKIKLSRATKRLIGFFLIFIIISILLNGHTGLLSEVNAAGGTSTMDMIDILNSILKFLYVLLWPLLFIAGIAMDNTLVYGAIFHLDAPLWKFWNIIKNFANFTLGFLVLFAVIKNIFKFGGDGGERSPMKIIKSTLIAGVLIQASRFLVAALVDVSTIATYAIGGLPLSIVGDNSDIGSKKILGVNTSLDISNTKLSESTSSNGLRIWYTTKDKNNKDVNLARCRVVNGYVVGREYGDTMFLNKGIFMPEGKNACVLFGNKIVFFNENPGLINQPPDQYSNYLNRMMGLQNDWTPREACGYFIRIKGATNNLEKCGNSFNKIKSEYQSNFQTTDTSDLDPFLPNPAPNTDITNFGILAGNNRFQKDAIATTFSQLIDKSKGFVGPLITMYTSLLNFTELSDIDTSSGLGTITTQMIIKMLVAIALFFPLVALSGVLIIRIGFLRVVIVGSPFLILLTIFKKNLGKIADSIGKNFTFENILASIFAPIIIVFAFSISLVFMQVLVSSLNKSDGGGEGFLEHFGLSKLSACKYEIASVNTIEDKGCNERSRTGTMDIFSRFLVNLFATGLLWFVVFAGIKASGTIGKSVGEGVQKLGGNLLGGLPLFKIPGIENKVGVKSLFNTATDNPLDKAVVANLINPQRESLEKLINNQKSGGTELTADNSKTIANILSDTTKTSEQTKTAVEDELKKQNKVNAENIITNDNNAKLLYKDINDKIKTANETDKSKIIENTNALFGENWFQKSDFSLKLDNAKTLDDANKLLTDTKEYGTIWAKEKINDTTYSKTFDSKEYKLEDQSGSYKFVEKTNTPAPAKT